MTVSNPALESKGKGRRAEVQQLDSATIRFAGDSGVAYHKAIRPAQESMNALNASFLPVKFAIRRRGKKRVHAGGIGTEFRDHIVRRNHVPFALGHLLSVQVIAQIVQCDDIAARIGDLSGVGDFNDILLVG